MSKSSIRFGKYALAGALGLFVTVGGLRAFWSVPTAAGAKPAPPSPLVLKRLQVPSKTLAAAASGGVPSNVFYTFTATNGPFCIQGLSINPGTAVAYGPGEGGDVLFHLNRINTAGMSHANVLLADNASGGISPQDIVISYGSQICASVSLEFQATHFQASTGPGVEFVLFGDAVILTADDNTVTVN